MNRFFDSVINFFKNKNKVKYKEIFSTTENKLNLKNTTPLEFIEENVAFNTSKVKSYLNDEFYNETRLAEFLSEETKLLYSEEDKSIKEKLKREVKSLKISALIIFFLFSISICFDILIRMKPKLLMELYSNIFIIYLSSSTILLILSCLVGFKILKSAFVHISCAIFTFDSAIIFPLILTFFYNTILIVFSFFYGYFCENTLTSLFIFVFLLTILNSLSIKKRVLYNFNFINSPHPKYNIDIYSLKELLNLIKTKNKLLTAYQYKTEVLNNFINNSFKATFFDFIISNFIPISTIFSILCGFFSFASSKNLILSLETVNICALIFTPIVFSFIINTVISSACNYALKAHSMIIGESAVNKLSKIRCIVLNDSDLYPPNNVILRGIKTFNGQRIDEAILYVAAVVCQLNSPISRVFDKIILGKRKILTKASNIVYNKEKGVVGWVNGKRILVGNRELLKDFKIMPPSRDYEEKYRVPKCELTYFAVGQNLVAMFILEYNTSKSLAPILISCIRNKNIKIFIKTSDGNINVHKISQDFGIDKKFLKILSHKDAQIINALYNKTTPKSEAFLSTLGSCISFIKTISICCLAKNNIVLVASLQILQLFLNIFFILYLIFSSSVTYLHTLELTIYSILWFIFTFLASKIKNLNK